VNIAIDTVGIIGYGRMGKVMYSLLGRGHFDVCVHEPQPETDPCESEPTPRFVSCEEAASSSAVILCVPILKFERIVKDQIQQHVKESACVLDVCSVKVYPTKILEETFAPASVLPTHPMFGPDSTSNGFEGKTMVLCPENTDEGLTRFWSSFFEENGLKVVEMTCEQHDRVIARTLCLTQLIGRALKGFDLEGVETDNVKRLREIRDVSCNDSPELFEGLHGLNPYASEVRSRFRERLAELEMLISQHKPGPAPERAVI
jgi:prephenate dehydrogenase